jgi:chemotaxis protein methyltransferase WspC
MQVSTVQANIETWLRDRFGWSAEIVGSVAIAKSIEQRRVACNLSDSKSYFQRLQASKEEQLELAECLIVPETWFFRDEKLFDFLSEHVRSQQRPMRFLSIPCSTGEEPYSIAMMLHDLGLRSTQFQIDAIDISPKNLLKAEQAIYRRNSFRSSKLEFRDRYFRRIDESYQLSDLIQRSVNFDQGNLLDPGFLRGKTYDIILCRNVLIYFDQVSRTKALRTIERLLEPKGLLCLGGAESIQAIDCNFASIRHPISFVYHKKASPAGSAKQHTQVEASKRLRIAKAQKPNINSSTKVQIVQSNSLEIARQLANQGNLGEAVEICERHLRQNAVDVEAHVLLGQIYQEQNLEAQAVQHFQKAVYLEPDHYQALVHLALLKEQQGETAKATILRQRLQRLEQQN